MVCECVILSCDPGHAMCSKFKYTCFCLSWNWCLLIVKDVWFINVLFCYRVCKILRMRFYV